MNPGWSYILTAIGVFGPWLAGRKDWRGWLVGLSAQGVWLAYAVATQQWGKRPRSRPHATGRRLTKEGWTT